MKKHRSVDNVSAAQSAHNPTFTVHGVNVVAVPPSFHEDGTQRRHFSAQFNQPPPTGLPYVPPILMRRPLVPVRRWWQRW